MNKELFESILNKENDPKIKSSLILNFIRHAEKDKDNNITEEGIRQSKKMGEEIPLFNNLTIASYFTDVPRTKQTLDAINNNLENQAEKQDINVEFRTPIALSSKLKWNKESESQLEKINMIFKKIEKNQSFTKAVEWWLSESEDAGNVNKWTNDFLKAIVTFLKLGTKLKENNHLMLNFVTHAGATDKFILSLLKQKDILEKKDSLDKLGGALKFLEKVSIKLLNLDNGETKILLIFRDYNFEMKIEEIKKIIENL